MITIRPMTNQDARWVAQLHAASITKGFLARLGHRFLAALYRSVAADPDSAVFVADEESRVLGFCAYARDVGAMYKRVLRSRFLRLGFASLPYSLNPWLLKEIRDTLRYPAKQSAASLPPAEILSIAVDDSARGKGVGRLLLDAVLDHARADGETHIKVLAGEILEGANRFYPACGFQYAAAITQHGEVLNVYVRDLTA